MAGTTPPQNHIFPLSATENKTMEEYIEKALKQSYILLIHVSCISWILLCGEKKEVDSETALTIED